VLCVPVIRTLEHTKNLRVIRSRFGLLSVTLRFDSSVDGFGTGSPMSISDLTLLTYVCGYGGCKTPVRPDPVSCPERSKGRQDDKVGRLIWKIPTTVVDSERSCFELEPASRFLTGLLARSPFGTHRGADDSFINFALRLRSLVHRVWAVLEIEAVRFFW
jgi:hypothetical protein